MGASDDARALVANADQALPSIRQAYESSLHAKEVSTDLLVQIKNFFENLRSALDFSARGLFDRYGSSRKADPKIYFPYALAAQDRMTFAHVREVERGRLLRASVACADVLEMLQGDSSRSGT